MKRRTRRLPLQFGCVPQQAREEGYQEIEEYRETEKPVVPSDGHGSYNNYIVMFGPMLFGGLGVFFLSRERGWCRALELGVICGITLLGLGAALWNW